MFMTPFSALFHLAQLSDIFFFSYALNTDRIVYLNPVFQKFFGISGSFDYHSLLEMIHPHDQHQLVNDMHRCIQGEVVKPIECRVVNGEFVRWLRVSPYLVKEDAQHYLMGHAEDVSTYKQP